MGGYASGGAGLSRGLSGLKALAVGVSFDLRQRDHVQRLALACLAEALPVSGHIRGHRTD